MAARQLLLRASDKLLTAAESPANPVALRVNCVRHLRYPVQILARDFEADMAQPDMGRLLDRCATVSNEVRRVAGWLLQPQPPPDGPAAMAGPPFAASMH